MVTLYRAVLAKRHSLKEEIIEVKGLIAVKEEELSWRLKHKTENAKIHGSLVLGPKYGISNAF